jgi:hypothetical protein
VHRNDIPIYIQQDPTLHSLFYLETAFHVSVGTTHHQERIQLYLQHPVFVTGLSVLWLVYATHSTLKPVPTLPRYRQIAVTV